MRKKHLVTGAFSYSGKYIARRLAGREIDILTMTGKSPGPEDNPRIEAFPYCFDDFNQLVKRLTGVSTLYNTYWVRFDHGEQSYNLAVENTKKLICAAAAAGVRRFVHVSITNPSQDSSLPYFKGKALLEKELAESGLSYAILRPTVLFGKEDILINNIAWLLRRFPVFGMIGAGDYKIQPVFVDDLAALAVRMGAEKENVTIDAVGPETFTFMELAQLIRKAVGSRAVIVRMHPEIALLFARLLGKFVGDVMLTGDEVEGLSSGLLVSGAPATCPTAFTAWLAENAVSLGSQYASEIKRHYR